MAVTQVDVAGSMAKGLQLRQLRDQQQAAQQAAQERNALKSLYSQRFGGADPQTGITWQTGRQGPAAPSNEQFVGQVAAIDPGTALDWQKHFASQDAAELERQKAEAPLFVAALEGVQDQATYDQAKGFLQQRGVDVSDMPPQYDPQTTRMVMQGSRYLGGITETARKDPEGFQFVDGRLQPIPGYIEGKAELAKATRAPERPEKQTPYSDLAKLNSDYKHGFISAEQFQKSLNATEAMDPKDAFDNADKLRDEFNTQSKDFVKVRDAYGRIIRSAEDPSAAGDLALIFNYMKVLDPGSTVREGEFATAEKSAGVPTQIRNIYNKVITGQRLPAAQRADFVNRAGRLYAGQEELHNQLRDQYTSLAERFELNPENVVMELRGQFDVSGQGGELQPGTVEDGYVFLGGDPANQDNWQQVR